MKVVARTKSGVMVEMTDEELAHVAGYNSTTEAGTADKTRIANTNDHSWNWRFRLGVEIQVSPMWDWMTKARDTFKKITDTGKLLHGLAEVLENAPPAALVDPDEAKTDG